MIARTVRGPRKYPLTPDQLTKLREMVWSRGVRETAQLLKCGTATVTELSTGGYVRVDTRDRVAKALEAA